MNNAQTIKVTTSRAKHYRESNKARLHREAVNAAYEARAKKGGTDQKTLDSIGEFFGDFSQGMSRD